MFFFVPRTAIFRRDVPRWWLCLARLPRWNTLRLRYRSICWERPLSVHCSRLLFGTCTTGCVYGEFSNDCAYSRCNAPCTKSKTLKVTAYLNEPQRTNDRISSIAISATSIRKLPLLFVTKLWSCLAPYGFSGFLPFLCSHDLLFVWLVPWLPLDNMEKIKVWLKDSSTCSCVCHEQEIKIVICSQTRVSLSLLFFR